MSKFDGLFKKMSDYGRKINYNTKLMYSVHEHFKMQYPELTESTFKRYCRYVCNSNKNQIRIEKPEFTNLYYKKKSDNFTRVVVLSDLHCGHLAGLTPPQWQSNPENELYSEYSELQQNLWKFYETAVDEILEDGPIDRVIVNGDTVDGDGAKVKGTEQITSDMYEQTIMAQECIEMLECDKIAMTYGSNYHQARGTDFEKILADNLGAKISDKLKLRINNKIFEIKHHTGGSSIPYSKATQVAKALMFDILESNKNSSEPADVVIRSHRHKYVLFQDTLLGSAIVTPCFQVRSKFGKRYFDGSVDIGFLVIDVYDSGEIEIKPIFADIKTDSENISDF